MSRRSRSRPETVGPHAGRSVGVAFVASRIQVTRRASNEARQLLDGAGPVESRVLQRSGKGFPEMPFALNAIYSVVLILVLAAAVLPMASSGQVS